jgi:hypothetical protein
VEKLLRYVVEEPEDDADSKRAFKFPFISCEIFTCEIDVILKTLVEDEKLMDLLFGFLEPNRPHSALLAGYFGKVVICLMIRKTSALMSYIKVSIAALSYGAAVGDNLYCFVFSLFFFASVFRYLFALLFISYFLIVLFRIWVYSLSFSCIET